MIRILVIVLLTVVSTIVHSRISVAGPHKDAFMKCLVESTSPADRAVFIRWLARVINSHPELQNMSNLTEDDRSKIDREVATYMERLLVVDCADAGRRATSVEGGNIIAEAFKYLGETSMPVVMQDPVVSKEGRAFVKYLDGTKLEAALGLSANK